MKNIIISIAIICNCYLLFKVNGNNINIQKAIELLTEKKRKIYSLEQNMLIRAKIEGNEIGDNIVFIDLENNELSVEDLYKKSDKFLFFSEKNCKDCIKAEIENLRMNNSVSTNDISIISDYKTLRELFLLSKSLPLKGFNFFLLRDAKNSFLLNKYNTPVYFYLDSKLSFKNVFIPTLDNRELTKLYLSQ